MENFLHLIRLGSLLQSFVVEAEGNISKRVGDEGFLIKASGSCLGTLSKEDFVMCDMDGNQKDNYSKKPSIETDFHSWIYNNSTYKFVAHTHPTNTLKVLCTELSHDFAVIRLFPDQVVFNGEESCLVPYATPGKKLTKEISKSASRFGCTPNVFLLQNHGVICCGNSIEEVALMTKICEKAAEVFIGCKLLSSKVFPTMLSDLQIQEIKKHEGEKHRKHIYENHSS